MNAAPNYSRIALPADAPPDAPECDVLERFAEFPDARRAELLWDFLDLQIEVAGTLVKTPPLSSRWGQTVVVRTDLAAIFADWLRDEGHIA